MSASKTAQITEEQKKQVCDIIKDAVTNGGDLALHLVPLDKEDGLLKLLSRGDRFNAAIARHISTVINRLAAKSQLEEEEVPSSFTYLVGYKQVHDGMEYLQGFKPKPISEQVKFLHKLIPGLGSADESVADKPLPDGAEAYFAIPRWEKVAPTYGEAVEKIFELIEKNSLDNFLNYRDGKLGPEYLREYEPSLAMWESICEAQEGNDILVVPAQFGLRHRGRSFRRVREVMVDGEFGLGLFAVACMLLTHPERLRDYDDLWIECPGDEYARGADGQYVGVPLFFHGGGFIRVDVTDFSRAKIGSATGFLLR